jgi:hypothetical protein
MSLTTQQLQNYAWMSQASYLNFDNLNTNDLSLFKTEQKRGQIYFLAN